MYGLDLGSHQINPQNNSNIVADKNDNDRADVFNLNHKDETDGAYSDCLPASVRLSLTILRSSCPLIRNAALCGQA